MLSADIVRYQEAPGTPGITTCEHAALTTPLLFDPGERWEYGISLGWVGKMTEAVSGQKLGDYLEHHLIAPLGMHSTSFQLSPSQRTRPASMHAREPDKALAVVRFELPQEPQFQMGGGLYGTTPDYLRFTRMLLHGGTFNGARVPQPETVHTMAQNHIGDLRCGELRSVAPALAHTANFFPGMPQHWGLNFLINTAPTPQGRTAGSLARAGLANTLMQRKNPSFSDAEKPRKI
jgi:CubicO group peptidase (beta-lactamase class C family)